MFSVFVLPGLLTWSLTAAFLHCLSQNDLEAFNRAQQNRYGLQSPSAQATHAHAPDVGSLFPML